jgi:hypothetical protein
MEFCGYKWFKVEDKDKIDESKSTIVKQITSYDSTGTQAQGDWLLTKHKKRTGYLPTIILTLEEDIIQYLSHELRHQWHRRKPSKSLWAWGCQNKRTKFSVERDASAYDKKKVREWRRLACPKEVYPECLW